MERTKKRTYHVKKKRTSDKSSKKSRKNTFAEKLQKGLEEILEFEEGKKTLRTHVVEIPERPIEYTPADIRKIREKGHYSQNIFALVLNVTTPARQTSDRERQRGKARLRQAQLAVRTTKAIAKD